MPLECHQAKNPETIENCLSSSEGMSQTNNTTWLEIEGCYSRVYALSLAYIQGPTLSIKDREKTLQTVDIVQIYVLL